MKKEEKMTDNRFDLDGTSRQILRELQKNASLTNQKLSERVGISPSLCWRWVSEVRSSGVITRTVTLLDPDQLGLSVSVFVHLFPAPGSGLAQGIRDTDQPALRNHGMLSHDRGIRLHATYRGA
ncbi:Lrp/AsnC family transcriptional regulator [Komagataeibacter medellinensis]|uniref:Lrp/AsnC family transcriptional regulator n=1 Tax=Komagataeibacter medellinensis TaxID=1177712 RepID=UPI001E563754|nr:winged helix-turn-helix transcriptional regulator [Komagataeibacter medellinensis]